MVRLNVFCKKDDLSNGGEVYWYARLVNLQDFCEASVSILIGKVKFMLYLYELTENLYGSAYSLYAWDAWGFVPLLASGVGVDVHADLLHHDEEGARVQAG